MCAFFEGHPKSFLNTFSREFAEISLKTDVTVRSLNLKKDAIPIGYLNEELKSVGHLK